MFRSIFLLFIGQICLAQQVNIGFEEKSWALVHPYTAMRIKKISEQCRPIYEKVSSESKLDKYSAGGSLDAFRHCFYMAAFAQKISVKKVRRLGEKHENDGLKKSRKNTTEFGETADSVNTVMDLRNNAIGILLGKKNPQVSLDSLAALVINEIHLGNAFKLKRNQAGQLIDCSGAIMLEAPNQNRQLPCLVRTNED